MRPCPSGGLGHVNQQLPQPWPGPHACCAHRRAGSLTTVGPSSSASSCPCGQCCSWSSGSGQTHPWHIAGTALSLRTLRWGPALCNTFQNRMDKSHQLPLMPFPPSFPGAAPAPVHCHGSHDDNKPYNWGRGAVFPQAQPHPSDFGWFGGPHNVGKITRAGEVGCGRMGSV